MLVCGQVVSECGVTITLLGPLPQPPTPKPTLHPLYGNSLHKAMGISRNNGTRLRDYCWNDFSILFFHSFVQVSYLSEIYPEYLERNIGYIT